MLGALASVTTNWQTAKISTNLPLSMLGGKPTRFSPHPQTATLTHSGFSPKFLTEQVSKLVKQFLLLSLVRTLGDFIVVAKSFEIFEPLLYGLRIERFRFKGQCRLSRRRAAKILFRSRFTRSPAEPSFGRKIIV